MKLPIEWSHEANQTFINTIRQIELKWTEREVESFIIRVEEVVAFIRQNPRLYPYSQVGLIHRAVITSQTSLYYHVTKENKIVLLSFEDNRQDPDRRK